MELFPVAQDLFWHHYLAHIKPREIVDTLLRVDRTNTSASLEKRYRDVTYEIITQGEKVDSKKDMQ